MNIFFPKEDNKEIRTSIVPSVVEKFVGLGATISTEEGIGETIGIVDKTYTNAGAAIVKDRTTASVSYTHLRAHET